MKNSRKNMNQPANSWPIHIPKEIDAPAIHITSHTYISPSAPASASCSSG